MSDHSLFDLLDRVFLIDIEKNELVRHNSNLLQTQALNLVLGETFEHIRALILSTMRDLALDCLNRNGIINVSVVLKLLLDLLR